MCKRATLAGMAPVATEATITCPVCATQRREAMPENACLRRYVCSGCGQTLTPKPGDCCVFCSYADAQCPPRARGEGSA